MKRLLVLLTLMMLSIGSAIAQKQQEVTGIVISSEDKQPVIGAFVRGKVSKKGGITNADGKFKVNIPATEKIIVINYVGFQPREVAVGKDLRIELRPDLTQLGEVEVAMPYGTTKKESLVGSQVQISAKEIEKRPVTNISHALSGLSPGVQVVTGSGQPGEDVTVNIRGFSSINATNKPLYVVDGSIFNGTLSDLNAQDIQNISVLKDASSTSLYGASAANGVILVTTKSGSAGGASRPHFSFSSNHGWYSRGAESYETVDIENWFELAWRQYFNYYKYNQKLEDEEACYKANYYVHNNVRDPYQPFTGIKTYVKQDKEKKKFVAVEGPQEGAKPLYVGLDGKINPEITGLKWADDLDWDKALLRIGDRHDYNFSGGLNTDRSRTYLSLGYLKEEGYKRRTSFERFSARLSVSYDITKWLRLGTNASFIRRHTERPRYTSGYAGDPFYFGRQIAPYFPIHEHDAEGNYILDGLGNKKYDYSADRPYYAKRNPVLEQDVNLSITDRDAISSRTTAEIFFSRDLKFKTTLAYDLANSNGKARFNNIMGDQPQGSLSISTGRYTTINFNQLFDYSKRLGRHRIDALVGHESYQYISSSFSAEKEKMFLLGVDEMNNLNKMTDISSGSSDSRKESYFSRFSYNYAGRYDITASYRTDGTSRFAPEYRWGHFYSFGAAWLINRERFMKGTTDWLDMLKLRASYGVTGNDNLSSLFPFRTIFSLGNSNNFEEIGIRVSNLGNPHLLWEKQISYDAAVEFTLFDRFSGTVEFFTKQSKDLLYNITLPTSTGVGTMDMNIGKMRNWGYEFDLHYTILKHKDYLFRINANGTIYKNVIEELPKEKKEDGIYTSDAKLWKEGHSRFEFYLKEFIGVDPDDGKAIYRLDTEEYAEKQANPEHKDFVGIEKEGEKATWTKDHRYAKYHYCGSSVPDLYGGFSFDGMYKDFDFSALFTYQIGGKVYDQGYLTFMGVGGYGYTIHKDMNRAWKEPGDITDLPAANIESNNYGYSTSDHFLIDASAIMLKNISVGYTVPQKWCRKLDMEKVRLSMMAENLWMKSRRKGLNPMAGYTGVSSSLSYDYAKIITLSLNITF